MNKKTTVEIIAKNERLDLKELALMVGLNPQNMYDIKSGKAKSVSKRIADKIIAVFPQYMKSWILTGEGEMYKDPPPKNDSTAIVNHQVGNGNHFASDKLVERFLDELAAERELHRHEIDRLLSIIEQFKK